MTSCSGGARIIAAGGEGSRIREMTAQPAANAPIPVLPQSTTSRVLRYVDLFVRAGDPMSTTFADLRSTPIATAAVIVAAGGAATILGAYFFQYVIGLKPCPLCLEQRFAYYFAIPLSLMALLGTSFGAS